MAAPPANQAGAVCYYDEALGQLVVVSTANGLPVSGGGGGGGDASAANQVLEIAGLTALLTELQIGGVPVSGVDAAGANAYATVVTAPARVCRHVIIQLDDGEDAIVSLDGGTSDSIYVKAGSSIAMDGLRLASGVNIQGKNAVGGANYTNLRISVW